MYKVLSSTLKLIHYLENSTIFYVGVLDFTLGPAFLLNLMLQFHQVKTSIDPMSCYLFDGLGTYFGLMTAVYFVISETANDKVINTIIII